MKPHQAVEKTSRYVSPLTVQSPTAFLLVPVSFLCYLISSPHAPIVLTALAHGTYDTQVVIRVRPGQATDSGESHGHPSLRCHITIPRLILDIALMLILLAT